MLKLDFIICGSPTDAFCSQIAFFRLCLDALGGKYRNARLVAVFGYETEAVLPIGWEPYFKNIEVDWVSAANAEEEDYNAQHYRRFELIRNDADFAIICDADIALLKPFCELLTTLREKPALAGGLAHFAPYVSREPDILIDWDGISQNVLGKTLNKDYQYSLVDPIESPMIPFYINYGVLIGSPSMLQEFYRNEQRIRPDVFAEMGPWWGPQVSLTLACFDANIPTKALQMRYNFPNDPIADKMYPEELEHIVFLHYLRTERFDRHSIFSTEDNFYDFINLELKDSELVLQKHVVQITKGVYPFHRHTASELEQTPSQAKQLSNIDIPSHFNRNAASVNALPPEETGQFLIDLATEAVGITTLADSNILDVGCGVRFTQTIINRSVNVRSYTGIEVSPYIVNFLKDSVEKFDERFHFTYWNVYHELYNSEGSNTMQELNQLPVKGSYNLIWLFSVFTHLNEADANSMLRLLRHHATQDGKLFFSAFIDPDLTGSESRTPDTPTLEVYYGLQTMQKMLADNNWQIDHFEPRNFELPIVDYFVCSAV
ncbi:MAG: hypothetical protein ACRBHB_15765 [Arenicella sp.]